MVITTRNMSLSLSPLAASLAALTALAGCGGPDAGMYGTVKTGPRCLPTDGQPEPVAGAHVALSCPNKPNLLVAVTDARGRFGVAAPTTAMTTDPACELVVEKEGYVSRHYPLMEVCWDAQGGLPASRTDAAMNHPNCHLLGASALLVRDPGAKGETP
jgi:hypothetical protein